MADFVGVLAGAELGVEGGFQELTEEGVLVRVEKGGLRVCEDGHDCKRGGEEDFGGGYGCCHEGAKNACEWQNCQWALLRHVFGLRFGRCVAEEMRGFVGCETVCGGCSVG